MPRIKPLPADAVPDLKETMETYRHHLGYVPNSPLVLARRPKVVKALAQMASAVWDRESSEVPLDFAIAAASQPNAVTDELLEKTRRHWSEAQIVEIAAAVAFNGFLNRWNDTMAIPLEPEPIAFGEKYLKRHGWQVGKHKP